MADNMFNKGYSSVCVKLNNKQMGGGGGYSSLISLGHFCSVASECERMGLRSFSSPFDWLITENFSVVLDLIDNGFADFLRYENLFQEYDKAPSWYVNLPLGIHFYHDFNATDALVSQIKGVQEKYQRRITRFYEKIKAPTLFVRYCYSAEEIEWIEQNYDEILVRLKKYNKENEIIFIINAPLKMRENIPCFITQKDEGDTVARKFFEKSPEIYAFIMQSYNPPELYNNLKRFARKEGIQKRIKKFLKKIKQKILKKQGVYRHNKRV